MSGKEIESLSVPGFGIDRAFPLREWMAPVNVHLATSAEGKAVLRASYDDPQQVRRLGPRLLEDFLRVTTEQNALRFANKWGLLGRPFSGDDQTSFHNAYGPEEKIEDWYSLRAQIAAILRNTARVMDGKGLNVDELPVVAIRTTTREVDRDWWLSSLPEFQAMIQGLLPLETRIAAVNESALRHRLTFVEVGTDAYIASRSLSGKDSDRMVALVRQRTPPRKRSVSLENVRRLIGSIAPYDIPPDVRLSYSRIALLRAMQDLLRDADVRPIIVWRTKGSPRIEYGSSARTLFAALAFQVALTFGKTALTTCDGCRNEFTPSRRPRRDRANYCPDCQAQDASQRAAEQRYAPKRARRRKSKGKE